MAKEIKLSDNTILQNWCDCSLYKGTPCFELQMRYEHVKMCCHSGSCDDDVKIVRNLDYIRKQLDKISCEQMYGYVSEFISYDISDNINDRDWLESYTIFLCAGDIMDDISMGYLDYRLVKEITIQEVRKSLIDDLEDEYTPKDIEFIDIRLKEIGEENNLTNEELDEYCWANSSEMFACIFDYKEFDKNNFEID